MTMDLEYLNRELEQLKKEYSLQKEEIENRVNKEAQAFMESHNLKESNEKHASIIREYRELKMRIYARELEPTEGLLTSVKNKINEIEKIYSD